MTGGPRPVKSYQVKNGIAILPVSGTLVHKMGTLRPYSGMTGYDGLTAPLVSGERPGCTRYFTGYRQPGRSGCRGV
ncbi:hypothetical protein ACLBOM_21335 [Escherichia coli]